MRSFYLLEGKQPRGVAKSRLAYNYRGAFVKDILHAPPVGKLSSLSAPSGRVRGKTPKWERVYALTYDMSQRLSTLASGYNLAIRILKKKELAPDSQQFAETFRAKDAAFLLRRCEATVWENPRDISSISPGVGSLNQLIDPATSAKVDLQGTDPADRQAMLATRSHTALMIEKALSTNKPRDMQDPMVVYSGPSVNKPNSEPYYILVSLHKEEKKGTFTPGVYELTVPSSLDFRKGFRSIAYMAVKETSPFKKWYSNGTLSVIHTESGSEPFEELKRSLMAKAWGFAEDCYIQEEKLKEAMEDLKKAKNSHNEKDTENAEGEIEVYGSLLHGKMPPEEYAVAFKDSAKWRSIAQNMPRSATWYMWLLAAEQAYGVLLPARQHLRSVARQHTSAITNEEGRQPIRQHKTVRGSGGWNREILSSLGVHTTGTSAQHYVDLSYATNKPQFSHNTEVNSYGIPVGEGDPDSALKRAIGNTKYGSEMLRDMTNIWVIASAGYIRRFGLHIAPSEITDFIARARKHHYSSRTLYLLGKSHGAFKSATNASEQITAYETSLGVAGKKFMLVNARSWLSVFDSPLHNGHRLEHTKAGPVIIKPRSERSDALEREVSRLVMAKRSFAGTQSRYGGAVGRLTPYPRVFVRAKASNLSSRVKHQVAKEPKVTNHEGTMNGLHFKSQVVRGKTFQPRTIRSLEQKRLTSQHKTQRASQTAAATLASLPPSSPQETPAKPPVLKGPLSPAEVQQARVGGVRPPQQQAPPEDMAHKENRPTHVSVYNREHNRDEYALAPGMTQAPKHSFDKSDPKFLKREKKISDTQKKIAALLKLQSK